MGIATDNVRCLADNYGWNPCMTCGEAATAMKSTIGAIRARYGARLRAIFIYQALDQRGALFDGNREHYFGALVVNGAPKGAFTAAIRWLLRAQH